MSEAVKTLPHAAFKVLTILATQCWVNTTKGTGQNGTAALTSRFAARFGLVGRDTLYRSLAELRRRGLIVVTREGLRIKYRFTLYALNWLPITHRDGQPLDQWEDPNTAAWENWTASTVPTIGNDGTDLETDGRDCTVPMAGTGRAPYVPMAGNRNAEYVPTIGNTSRYLGEVGGRGAGQCSPVIAAKVLKFIGRQPHLTDGEVANTFKAHSLDAMAVAAIRARATQ